MVTVNREGFTALSGSEDAASQRFLLNIIFVHGLRGHPRTTWSGTLDSKTNPDVNTGRRRKDFKSVFGLKTGKTKPIDTEESEPPTPTGVFWPEEYLLSDIPEARIWTYGYNVDVIGGLFQSNNKNSVSQHGRDLAVRLEREIENEDPIVFVAHSLGGIIVKDALRRSKKCRNNTRFIVFLGTPHRGSGYASWGEIASNLARLGLQDSNKRVLETLEVSGEVLDNIHDEFKNVVGECGIKVHSFQEAHGISGMKGLHQKVVDDFSSKLDFPSAQETVETIDANHMQMTKCRSRDDARYRAILGVLKQFARKEVLKKEMVMADPVGQSLRKSLFVVPFSKDDHFVGREDILANIDMTDKRAPPLQHQRVAIVGLGGVGKSQIAIEYAYRTRKRAPQTSVFWIHASNVTRFQQGFTNIAEKAGLPGRDDPQVNTLQLVSNWLSDEANGQWLLILDNVDDDMFFCLDDEVTGSIQQGKTKTQQQPLETFLPQSPNGTILITSRNSTAARNLVGHDGSIVEVEPMAEPEALELLETRVPLDEASRKDASALVQVLEYIPLAITHAAAYIRTRPRMTISIYLQLFQEGKASQANLLNNHDTKDLRRDYSIRHPVITTWQMTFDQLRRTAPAAADLLALLSMFDRQGIPEFLLHGDEDQLQFEDAIAPLMSFSLVKQQAKERSFEMHRLVQLSTRKWLESNRELQKWISEALKTMVKMFPTADYESWSDCQALLPHSKEVLAYNPIDEQDILNHGVIGERTGSYLVHRGEYAVGELMLRGSLEASERTLGKEHPNTVGCVHNLAWALRRCGKYEEAEHMHRRVVESHKMILEKDHPDALVAVSNLVVVLNYQGKYEEAEQMARQVLEISEKALGEEHPTSITAANNLALTLNNQGKHEESGHIFRRVVEGNEIVLGEEHPETLLSVSNLASVLCILGKYVEAEHMQRRALKGREKVFGNEHPDTLESVYHLAFLHHQWGHYDTASELYKKACDAFKKVLGPQHPTTIACRNSFSKMVEETGGSTG